MGHILHKVPQNTGDMSSDSESAVYYLPGILDSWPWDRKLSPYYEEIKEESLAWLETFRPFESPVEKERYDRCDFG